MFSDAQTPSTDLMVCGVQLPPGTVGNAETVACRGQAFWLYPRQGNQVFSKCLVCKTTEDLRLFGVGWGGKTVASASREEWLGDHGERLCGAVGQGPPCQEARFRLLDNGNEIVAACVTCGCRDTIGVRAARK
jgi:hypothetical protein